MFQTGSSHTAVKTLNSHLISRSDISTPTLKPVTSFDKDTRAAVASFQKLKGLIPTGRMDLKTWMAVGAEMNPIQIIVLAGNDMTLRNLLGLGYVSKRPARNAISGASLSGSPIHTSGKKITPGSYSFNFLVYVSIFAPFDYFGPFNWSTGDKASRRFGTNPRASYRLQCFATVPVAPEDQVYKWAGVKVSPATDSFLWTPWNQTPDAVQSEGFLSDYNTYTDSEEMAKEVFGADVSLNYHIYGNDDAYALWGNNSLLTSDIDLHTNFNFHYEPQANPKKVSIRASGKVVGDQFPAVEIFVVDKSGNGVMLGVWQVNEGDGPVFTKDGKFGIEGDKQLPMIDFDITINTEDGNFTGILKDGRTVPLAQHNQYYTNLPPVKPGRKPGQPIPAPAPTPTPLPRG